MPDSYRQLAEQYLKTVRGLMDQREAAEMVYLADKWQIVQDGLAAEIERLAKAGLITPYQVGRSAEYQALLAQANRLVEIFANDAVAIISNEQKAFAALGWAPALAGVDWVSRSLPVQAILNMIGRCQDGSSLYDMLMKNYPDVIGKITDTLIRSTAMGIGPRETARLMAKDADVLGWKVLRIARTEQLNVFRAASLENYKRFGIGQWEWLAQPDACEECLSENGSIHDVDDIMDTHPSCRCCELPVIAE
jgi:SPP1 gp7 family putative phage head morphogenesis protein